MKDGKDRTVVKDRTVGPSVTSTGNKELEGSIYKSQDRWNLVHNPPSKRTRD